MLYRNSSDLVDFEFLVSNQSPEGFHEFVVLLGSTWGARFATSRWAGP
jgi:hypothetical protein